MTIFPKNSLHPVFQCTACGAILLREEVDGLNGHARTEDDGRGNPIRIHCGPVEVRVIKGDYLHTDIEEKP